MKTNTRQDDADFAKRQIEFHKQNIVDSEHYIKVWRVHKMFAELSLWHNRTNKSNLFWMQHQRLETIFEKILKNK
jgi:hypothetical protein